MQTTAYWVKQGQGGLIERFELIMQYITFSRQ